jgi:hypothetical protein
MAPTAARSCRSNGRIPDRFAGRSRVVSRPGSVAVALSHDLSWRRLSSTLSTRRAPLFALRMKLSEPLEATQDGGR